MDTGTAEQYRHDTSSDEGRNQTSNCNACGIYDTRRRATQTRQVINTGSALGIRGHHLAGDV